MKKLTAIVLAVALLACGFGGGILGGYKIFGQKDKTVSDIVKNDSSGIIAVVSQDVGVNTENGNVNYTEAFVNKLDRGSYVSTSATDAENGIQSGEYDGAIIFPATLSEQILNSGSQPNGKIQIKYSLSKELGDHDRIEAHEKVIDLYNRFNDNLSYAYIKSVFDQVGIAQYSAKEIFSNDKKDIAVARKLAMQNYMEGLKNKKIPEVKVDAKKADYKDTKKYPYLNPDSEGGKNYIELAIKEYNSIYGDACDKAFSGYAEHYKDYKTTLAEQKKTLESYQTNVKTAESNLTEPINAAVNTINNFDKKGKSYNDLSDYIADLEEDYTEIDKYYNELENWKKEGAAGDVPKMSKALKIVNQNKEIPKVNWPTIETKTIDENIAKINTNTEALINNSQTNIETADSMSKYAKSQAKEVKNDADKLTKKNENLNNYKKDFMSQLTDYTQSTDTAQQENQKKIEKAYEEYSKFVDKLVTDTTKTYDRESQRLEKALNAFLKTMEANSADTKKQLSAITGMFDDGKDDTGNIDNEYLQFLIQPVEIIELQ